MGKKLLDCAFIIKLSFITVTITIERNAANRQDIMLMEI
jgi:hypothetical protein